MTATTTNRKKPQRSKGKRPNRLSGDKKGNTKARRRRTKKKTPKHPSLGITQTIVIGLALNREQRNAFQQKLVDKANELGWRRPAHARLVREYAEALQTGVTTVPAALCKESRNVVAEVFMDFCESRGLVYEVVDTQQAAQAA